MMYYLDLTQLITPKSHLFLILVTINGCRSAPSDLLHVSYHSGTQADGTVASWEMCSQGKRKSINSSPNAPQPPI